MSIDIEHILLEILQLPKYKEQISLQISENGEGAEGKLLELNHKEKDFNKFAFDLPYTNSVMANLGMYRSRLMKMSSKTCYSYHRDPTKRIHIPLITNDKCFFVIDDEVSYYPADGSHYLVDTTKKHTFVNASWEDRIHIVGCTNEVV